MNRLVIPALILLLTSCGTPYQSSGLSGGVKSSMIDSSTAQISVKVNAYTGREVAFKYAILKAAETTVQNGFGHFQIVYTEKYDKTTSNTVYNPYVGYYGGFQSYSVKKPRIDMIVRMFKGEKPNDAPPNVYDAADVISTIGPTVKRG